MDKRSPDVAMLKPPSAAEPRRGAADRGPASDPRGGEGERPRPGPVWVFGLPLVPLTFHEVVGEVSRLVRERRPSYVITANLNYAMLTHKHPDLADVNRGAALVVADGMPLVWASRRSPAQLPQRVAGSDLIFAVCQLSALWGYRVFFLGGAPGVAEEASRKLTALYPGLNVVGTDSPPYRETTPEEHAALVAKVHAAQPDILITSLSQPKGEMWLSRHCQELRVPVCIQLGASLDFAAGKVRRAPLWMQKAGLEWAFRLWLEPRRLAYRYFSNLLYLLNWPRYARRAASECAPVRRDVAGATAGGVPL